MRSPTAILFVVFFCVEAHAQYIFQNFTADKGLSGNEATAVLQDRAGFIWVGTRNGLNRFDGTECLIYGHDINDTTSLSDNIVRCLYQDRKGILWAGTRDGGLNRMDPLTLQFTAYKHRENDPSSLPSDFINLIFEDRQGNLMVACHSNGICTMEAVSGKFTCYHPGDRIANTTPRLIGDILCYAHDPADEQTIWLGSQQGLLSFNTKTKEWQHYPIDRAHAENGSLYSGREEVIRCMIFDPSGMLWFGTWGGGLACFDPQRKSYHLYKYEPLNPVNGFRNNISQLVPKSADEFYFVAPHQGIGTFRLSDKSFTFIPNLRQSGKNIPNPLHLLADKEGSLFVASMSHGLFYCNTRAHQFEHIPLPYPILDLKLNANQKLLFGACRDEYGKLMVRETETGTTRFIGYRPLLDISENQFTSVIPSGDRIWLLENNMLYFWKPGGNAILPYTAFNPSSFSRRGEHPHYFLTGLADREKQLWLGTKYSGIFRVDPERRTAENFYTDPATNRRVFEDWILCLFEDRDGNVWYGTIDFGYYDLAKKRFFHFISEKDLPGADLSIKKVAAITQTPDGRIWLGTSSNGIAVLQMAGEKPVFITSYTQRNGLASNQVSGLLPDGEGNVWAATAKGLSRISPTRNVIDNFDGMSGILPVSSMTKSSVGIFFLGTGNGFYQFDPSGIKPPSISTTPYIKSVKVFDVEMMAKVRADPGKPLEFGHQQDFVAIEYGAISYFQPGEIRFSYMLKGLNDRWQEAGTRRYVSFANLRGGDYEFRLRTSQGGETALFFRIRTPYWETWWFILLSALSLGAIVVLFIRYRLRRIRKQEALNASYSEKINQLEMKALRAQMNPHFLFNSLNSIRYYILKNETGNASDYITKFSRLLRLIIRNSRHNQISLSDELEALKIYIEFEQMRFSHKFEFSFTMAEGITTDDILIQPMTIQPFVENAIWHGLMPLEGAGMLRVGVKRDADRVQVIVEDNGIGRKRSMELKESELTASKSYGLKIVEDRMKLMKSAGGIKAGFSITDLYDEQQNPAGTRVVITFGT